MLQQAEVWAKELVERPDESVAARVDHMFVKALNRPPSKEEQERFGRFVGQIAKVHQLPAAEQMSSRTVWQAVAQALFNVQEFVYTP